MIGVGLMVAAAVLNAVASVLQRRAARDQPEDAAVSVRLLWNLARRPGWIVGVLSMTGGFVVMCIAITVSGVALVQPVLVVELPFAILLAARVLGARVGRREWLAILLQSAGLAAFLGCLAPDGGDPLQVRPLFWCLGIAVTVVVIAGLTVAGYRCDRERRAAWLGVASGTAFGLNAALVSGVGASVTHGLSGVFTAWQTYAVLVVGGASFLLLQTALKAGSLVASQPGFTLGNPVVAVGWGLTVLGEHGRGGVFLVGSVGGALLIGVGTVVLARSPLLDPDRPKPVRQHAGTH